MSDNIKIVFRTLPMLASYLAVSFQLILQPLEVTVPPPDARVLQFEDGKVCLKAIKKQENINVQKL